VSDSGADSARGRLQFLGIILFGFFFFAVENISGSPSSASFFHLVNKAL
jgi:hypothetical protein